ncbi:hypothetical protein PIB30_016399 [Stylosanthes scabra]|uniref:Uncharacterized protein n=1 Tax=Stylosanthes scabra TaxID=79078 RepID=A0ABU6U6A7_9FABA|nr:hypothetical protein [Stylosanthes scabra]
MLADMTKTILRNMLLPKVFLISNDEHIQAMFASHRRILSDQVMHLYVQLLETQTTIPGAGLSHSGHARDTPIADPASSEQAEGGSESSREDAGDIDGKFRDKRE